MLDIIERSEVSSGFALKASITTVSIFTFLTGLGFFLGSLLALEGVFVTLVVFSVSFFANSVLIFEVELVDFS